MGHVRKPFESLPWMTLRPAPDAVKQLSGDPLKFVSAARTNDGSLYVFYFPAAATAEISVASGKGNDAIRWFDPRRGQWLSRGQLSPPDEEDWVLVLH
jgi:hypothetical protein